MDEPSNLVARLSARALSVCKHYLSNGQKVGNYWVVGDARNTPGRSTFVRLCDAPPGRSAGRWMDAATGEYGDLLDIIRFAIPSGRFADALAEAKSFVDDSALVASARLRANQPRRSTVARQARTLFDTARPIHGTLAETYLRNRSIDPSLAFGLRFAPHCYCRPGADSDRQAWPAIIAPVTDGDAALTGVHRLYLDPLGAADARLGKAPLDRPKRSLGRVHGHAVRFGDPAQVIAVAEGIENALSIRTALPDLTSHAALTAGNLASYTPPAAVNRLLIAVDDDDAGWWAARTLADRARLAGLSVALLAPRYEDHNRDLCALGLVAYRASLLERLAP